MAENKTSEERAAERAAAQQEREAERSADARVKAGGSEIRMEVAAPPTGWLERFHTGSIPQRPIPTDLSEAEQKVIMREQRSIRGTGDVVAPPEVVDEEGNLVRVEGPVWIDPDRPNKGVLYVGPTAEEELAIRTGRSSKDAEALANAPRERVNELRREQAKARR